MRKIFSLLTAVLFAGSMYATEVTLDYSTKGYSNGASLDGVAVVQGDVTFTLAKGTGSTAPGYYTTGPGARTYGGNTLTIDAGDYTISNIEFNLTQNNKNYTVNVGTYSKDNKKWTGSASKVVFTTESGSGHNRIKAITVTYAGTAPAVLKPTITGTEFFYDETDVTITCGTDGAVIYYTLEGSEPSASSTPYSAPFKLTETKTVKAIAIKGDDKSQIAEKTFTLNPSFASFDELIAAGLATNTLVEVSFANLEIDSIYSNKSENRQGVYFAVNETKYEIYYSKVDVPETWIAGGLISGTIRGNWTYFSGGSLWELVPSASDWQWTSLTYKAPTVDLPKIELWGSWDDFAQKLELTPAINNLTASCAVELTEVKDYEFAFIYEESIYYLPTIKITRENNSGVCEMLSGNAKIEADYAGEYTFTWTYETKTVTVTYPTPKYTVTFDLGVSPDKEQITETVGGEGITLPAGPELVCAEWKFAGWAAAAVAAETNTAPTLYAAGANYKPASDVTLYAVYKRVEGADFDGTKGGDFYIYANVGGTNYYATAFAGKIDPTTNIDEAIMYTFEKIVEDEVTYFAIKSDGKYLGYGTSGTDFNYAGTTPYKWQIGAGVHGTWRVNATTGTSRALVYRAGTTSKFGAYATSNVTTTSEYYDVEIAGGTVYYLSTPTCWATSVDNTVDTKKAVKFIENGQLFIELNGHIYNVQGQIIK